MADTTTTHYAFVKPQVGASADTWGDKLNADLDSIDTTIFNGLAACLPLAGGTLTGVVNTVDVLPKDNSNRKLGSAAFVYSDVFVQNWDCYAPGSPPTLLFNMFGTVNGCTMKCTADTQAFQINDSTNTVVVKLGADGNIQAATAQFSGIVQADDFSALSDERLKENIASIEDALSKILLLRGVEFNWREHPTRASAGVIAQDVEKVLPSAVTESGGYKVVSYNQIWALAIEAIRTLSERVTALEGRNQTSR